MIDNKQHVKQKKVTTIKMGGQILLIMVVIAEVFACGGSDELELASHPAV